MEEEITRALIRTHTDFVVGLVPRDTEAFVKDLHRNAPNAVVRRLEDKQKEIRLA